jgi:hypothetical protein
MATTYTDEQRAAYKAGLAAAKKKGSPARKGSGTAARTPRRRKTIGKKRSGCKMEESYTIKATGEHINRPRIRGWRISKEIGFQSFTAFLGANNGEPKNPESRDRFRNFVVNMKSQLGTSTENAVYDNQYGKLKFIELGLVANPKAANGGYFGKGGARYKDKATKGR